MCCACTVPLFKPIQPGNHTEGDATATPEQIGLGGCPQRKQSRQRVAAQNDFDVLRERILLLQCGNDLLRQKAQGVPSIAAETLLSPRSRGFPRRKCIVPVLYRNSGKQKLMCALCNSSHFVIHALQLVFAGHLEQQVFCMSFAVNAARSVPDLHCLCASQAAQKILISPV